MGGSGQGREEETCWHAGDDVWWAWRPRGPESILVALHVSGRLTPGAPSGRHSAESGGWGVLRPPPHPGTGTGVEVEGRVGVAVAALVVVVVVGCLVVEEGGDEGNHSGRPC